MRATLAGVVTNSTRPITKLTWLPADVAGWPSNVIMMLAVLWVSVLVASAATLGAEPQQPDGVPPVSLDRIREGLEQAPALRLETDVPLQLPPTFKSRVDQRVFVLTLEEALHKEFDLTDLQRQSAEWSAKCCGYNVGQLVEIVNKALRDRKIRKTREQIARELAELEAARKKIPAAEVKQSY